METEADQLHGYRATHCAFVFAYAKASLLMTQLTCKLLGKRLLSMCIHLLSAGPDSTVCSVSRRAFGSSQVLFHGSAPFISCQLLVKG